VKRRWSHWLCREVFTTYIHYLARQPGHELFLGGERRPGAEIAAGHWPTEPKFQNLLDEPLRLAWIPDLRSTTSKQIIQH